MTPDERRAAHDRFVTKTRLRNLYRDWRPELESVLRLMRHGTDMDDALEQVGMSRPLFTEVLREHERQHRNRLQTHEQRKALALAAIEAALPHPITYSELAAALALKVEAVVYLVPAWWRERYPPDLPMAPDPEGRDWTAWGVEHDAPGARHDWKRAQPKPLKKPKPKPELMPRDVDALRAITREPGMTTKMLRRVLQHKAAGAVQRLEANGLVMRTGATLHATAPAAELAEAVAQMRAEYAK